MTTINRENMLAPSAAAGTVGRTPAAPGTSRFVRETVNTPAGQRETIRVVRTIETPAGLQEVTPRVTDYTSFEQQVIAESSVGLDAFGGPGTTPAAPSAEARRAFPGISGQAPASAIPAAVGGGNAGFARGKNCDGCARNPGGPAGAAGLPGAVGAPGEAGAPIVPTTPPGTPLSADEQNALFTQLESQEAARRAAAGLPSRFTEAERRSILGILASEGGNSAGNLATLLNRSYQSNAPINEVVFASRQFTPATSYLENYTDRMAGLDTSGFNRFVGGYYGNATSNLRDAVTGYQPYQAAGVNYFNARQLGSLFGTPVLDSGNIYQAGNPGNFAYRGGDLYNRFLEVTAGGTAPAP